MLENCKIMHLRLNFNACSIHSLFMLVNLTHQNLGARALFCHISPAKINTQLSIYNSYTPRILRTCFSQSESTILKIRESSERAFFFCTIARVFITLLYYFRCSCQLLQFNCETFVSHYLVIVFPSLIIMLVLYKTLAQNDRPFKVK